MSRPLLSSCTGRHLGRVVLPEAEAVGSCAAPVGRGSLGWMPLAARHGDFTDDGEIGAAARRCPPGLGFVQASVTSNLVGEVGD